MLSSWASLGGIESMTHRLIKSQYAKRKTKACNLNWFLRNYLVWCWFCFVNLIRIYGSFFQQQNDKYNNRSMLHSHTVPHKDKNTLVNLKQKKSRFIKKQIWRISCSNIHTQECGIAPGSSPKFWLLYPICQNWSFEDILLPLGRKLCWLDEKGFRPK